MVIHCYCVINVDTHLLITSPGQILQVNTDGSNSISLTGLQFELAYGGIDYDYR